MKITVEVPNEHIDGALEAPHSRYWASEAVWTRVDGSAEGMLSNETAPSRASPNVTC